MNRAGTMEQTHRISEQVPGYEYGSPKAAKSPINVQEFELMKQSAGFTKEDEGWLHAAGEVLADQTKALVGKWREVIAAHPHLAKYSQRPNGEKDPRYSADSGLRFQQWVIDTCFRPYDQDWLNYQQEIGLRHTSQKKNKTDHVESAPMIPLRYVLSFGAVVTDPEILKPFLARGRNATEVDKMYRAWSKSIWLQMALWTEPYTDPEIAPREW